MRIRELSKPVVAAKADWLPSTAWLGFTPQGKGFGAKAKCEATIQKQCAQGLVLERITINFEEPNPTFANDERVMHDRKLHESLRDSLLYMHELRTTSLPLERIVGADEFRWLQDTWSKDGQRHRWSVAFPVVRCFEIVGAPKAKDVFSKDVYSRVFQSQSATLRPLDDEARTQIRDLQISEVPAGGLDIAIDQDAEAAGLSTLAANVQTNIERDLRRALEGQTEVRRAKIIKRAAWLAQQFAKHRIDQEKLRCDHCGFDPSNRPELAGVAARSCLDVHHLHPLSEGTRLTDFSDLALLCPTCHRIAHLLKNKMAKSRIDDLDLI